MSVAANLYYDCQSGVDNSTFTCIYQEIMFDLLPNLIPFDVATNVCLPWMWAIVGSMLVGLSGVLPLLIIPIDQTDDLKQGASANKLKTLLSFAVGGLLGDVFLHSLPEIWAKDVAKNGGTQPSIYSGLLILSGLIMFVITEKLFTVIQQLSDQPTTPNNIDIKPPPPPIQKQQNKQTKSVHERINNNIKDFVKTDDTFNNNTISNNIDKKHITGYLNLIANMIDNFTHGLSLGGAFLVSFRLGCLTTFAILVHEIPHEVGDFAILLKSGFTRWEAAKLQLFTAGGGLLGSLAAIACSGAANSIEARTSWILPFTAGTFLHIALVTVLPDLLKEEDPKESFKQFAALLLGISIMAFVTTALE